MAPLQDLLDYLQEAVETTYPNETISIPRNIVNAVLQLSPVPDFPDIDRLVELFDGLNEGGCSRLDASSFQCILYILLGGQWGLVQERGLYLFLSSLRQLKDQSTAVSAQLKSTIGQKILQLCLTHFTDADGPRIPRRWSGRFLQELVRDSEDNKEVLASGPEGTRRGLGKIVLHGSDYALRLIAGGIIGEMVSAKFDPKIFWPLGSSRELTNRFPSIQLGGPEWIKHFHSFIKEIDKGRDGAENRQYMGIAQVAPTDGPTPLGNDSLLGLIVSNCLTLIYTTTSASSTEFIDIMFDSIERCSFEEERHSIDLELIEQCRGNYVTNGLMMSMDKLCLLFGDREQAIRFLTAIEQRAPQLGQFSPNTGEKKRHISAAYVALAGPSSPMSIPPGVIPTPYQSKPKGKETKRAPRVASFAILPLPSQEEVVARSSAFLDAQLSPRNGDMATWGSDNSIAIDDCPELIGSSSKTEKQHEPQETAASENMDCDAPIMTETENHTTAEHSRESRGADTKVDNEYQVIASMQVVDVDGSMRLQEGEGPPTCSGLPSPVQETPQPPSPHNLQLQTSASLERGLSRSCCLAQCGNHDASISGGDCVEIPDSQQETINSNLAQQSDRMASVDDTASTGVELPVNVAKSPITPAEISGTSRLKRPRVKIVGSCGKNGAVDWDQDLRLSGDEQDVPSNKKPKKAHVKTSIPAKPKSAPAPKPKKQAKPLPKTPKTETPATIKKPKPVRKRPPTKTLTSTRQLRAAAGRANERIAKAKNDESDNFDIDDPIETTSPEPSPLETPVTRPGVSNKVSRLGEVDANLPAQEIVSNADEHEPIILDSPIDDGAVPGHSLLERSITSPTPKESLILETSVNDIHPALLCCVDSQPRLQDADVAASPKSSVAKDISSPEKSISPNPPDDIRPECNTQRASSQEIALASDGKGKQTFGEKLSLVLAGAGILSPHNAKAGEESILQIRESTFSPVVDSAENTTCPGRQKVSHVSQKVAEFMLRKSATGKLPADTENTVSTANPPVQNVEDCIHNGGEDSHSTKSLHSPNIPSHQVGTKPRQYGETPSTKHGPDLTCPPPPAEPTTRAGATNSPAKKETPNQTSSRALVDDRIHRKTQVVSFDVEGPRNQGLSSTKKSSNRPPKQFTPILKEPRKSTILKRKADAEPTESDPHNKEEGDRLLTPTTKRLMVEPLQDEADTIIDEEDTDSVHELLRSEMLSQTRAPQLFGSQQSMVDLNGSPRRVTRVPREVQTLAKAHSNEPTTNDRTQKRVTGPNVVEIGDTSLKTEGNFQIQSSGEDSERGSDDENIEAADSNSEPEQKAKPKEKEEGRGSTNSKGAAFLFQAFKASAQRPLKKHKSRDTINPPESDIKLSCFIDSLTSRRRPTGYGSDVDSEAETEILDDDTDSLSSYSTDSTPSESSETLIQPEIDADTEWQNTLRSTQKTTLDILLDTSKRLVRHLVDEETAITDLVTIYRTGCEKLLEQLQQAHDASLRDRERQMEPLKKNLLGIYGAANSRLKLGRERVQKIPSSKELLSAVRKRKNLISRLS